MRVGIKERGCARPAGRQGAHGEREGAEAGGREGFRG